MRLLKHLPVYAAGVGFTVGVIAVSDGYDWRGTARLALALAVAGFYVVTILVPFSIREQLLQKRSLPADAADARQRRTAERPGENEHDEGGRSDMEQDLIRGLTSVVSRSSEHLVTTVEPPKTGTGQD